MKSLVSSHFNRLIFETAQKIVSKDHVTQLKAAEKCILQTMSSSLTFSATVMTSAGGAESGGNIIKWLFDTRMCLVQSHTPLLSVTIGCDYTTGCCFPLRS